MPVILNYTIFGQVLSLDKSTSVIVYSTEEGLHLCTARANVFFPRIVLTNHCATCRNEKLLTCDTDGRKFIALGFIAHDLLLFYSSERS